MVQDTPAQAEKDSFTQLSLPAPAQILRAKTLQSVNRVIAINISILEDLANEHDAAMTKLRDALPPEYKPYVDLADHFSDEKFGTLRNRILRACNDARREIDDTVDSLRL
jgi:hypothetical protein